jgi:hypothetical protein
LFQRLTPETLPNLTRFPDIARLDSGLAPMSDQESAEALRQLRLQ